METVIRLTQTNNTNNTNEQQQQQHKLVITAQQKQHITRSEISPFNFPHAINSSSLSLYALSLIIFALDDFFFSLYFHSFIFIIIFFFFFLFIIEFYLINIYFFVKIKKSNRNNDDESEPCNKDLFKNKTAFIIARSANIGKENKLHCFLGYLDASEQAKTNKQKPTSLVIPLFDKEDTKNNYCQPELKTNAFVVPKITKQIFDDQAIPNEELLKNNINGWYYKYI